MSAHYYDWKPIGYEQAKRALERGGALFALPARFGNGMAVYSHALETKRGTCYLVSDWTLSALRLAEKPQSANANAINLASVHKVAIDEGHNREQGDGREQR